jgi:hypothetical protein
MTNKESSFDRAKRIYLPAFLRSLGLTVNRQGNDSSYGMDYCPKCHYGKHRGGNKVSVFVANDRLWRWKCYSCDSSPSTSIDFAAQHWGCSVKEAVERINNDTQIAIVQTEIAKPQDVEVNEAMVKAIKRLKEGAGCLGAKKYLGQRGIPDSLVEEAHGRGLVYSYHDTPYEAKLYLTERVGYPLLKKAGFLKHSAWPAIAFRPLVFPFGNDGAEFRLTREPKDNEPKAIRYGRLHHPWWWKSQEDKNSTLIVEGVIDALSVIAMGWKGHVLPIPGVSGWREDWFVGIHKKYPKNVFHLGLDADTAGQNASDTIKQLLAGMGCQCEMLVPFSGKDWNETLLAGNKF